MDLMFFLTILAIFVCSFGVVTQVKPTFEAILYKINFVEIKIKIRSTILERQN